MPKVTIKGTAPDIERVINLIESKYNTEKKDGSKSHNDNDEVVLLITHRNEEKPSEILLPKVKFPLRSKKFTCKRSDDLNKIVDSLNFISNEEEKYKWFKKFMQD